MKAARREGAISGTGVSPIRTVFEDVETTFPGLIPQFHFWGRAGAVRSQVVFACPRIDEKIQELESENESFERRNELKATVAVVRELVENCLDDVEQISTCPCETFDEFREQVGIWVEQISKTRSKVFVSVWQRQRFEEAVSLDGDPSGLRCRHILNATDSNRLVLLGS